MGRDTLPRVLMIEEAEITVSIEDWKKFVKILNELTLLLGYREAYGERTKVGQHWEYREQHSSTDDGSPTGSVP